METIEQRAKDLSDIFAKDGRASLYSILMLALKQERQLAVQECDNQAKEFWERFNAVHSRKFCHYEDSGLHYQLLSVAKIEPQKWEHKPDCPTPYQWDEKEERWLCYRIECCETTGTIFASDTALYCDGCGAPKPERKP